MIYDLYIIIKHLKSNIKQKDNMTDPIADMLTRIRNGYMVQKKTVDIPYSNVKEAIASKLKELNYLADVSVAGEGKDKVITTTLSYKNERPVVNTIKRVSTPGRRNYLKAKDIKPVLSGHGSTILSTSKGILSDMQAKKEGVGGEVICQVW